MTALDSDVLVDLLGGSAVVRQRAERLVYRATAQGPLVISPVVFAELRANPNATADELDHVLQASGRFTRDGGREWGYRTGA